MKRIFGILALTALTASSAFAKIPAIISCVDRSGQSLVSHTFEFRTLGANSYVDFFVWERAANGTESRSSITAPGTHDAQSDLFRLKDGGFVHYDASSSTVTFQFSGRGQDLAQTVGPCELPEPGAGTGN